MKAKSDPEAVVREIKRKTRKKYSAEEKIRIVLEGLRGEESISALCRREGISPNLYYRWSKDFLEAVACGGHDDEWMQEREQWHSGANFFALAPGQVIGYGRNVRTIDELDHHGFAVVEAADILAGKAALPEPGRRCVVTIRGSELSRGGGGCRCMTLPLRRSAL